MEKVSKILEETKRYKDIEKIGMAKVPIIKLRDTKFNIPIDLSFNQLDGLNQVIEVDRAHKFYPELKYLMIFLKYFLHQRELNETY